MKEDRSGHCCSGRGEMWRVFERE